MLLVRQVDKAEIGWYLKEMWQITIAPWNFSLIG
jgi:hypothetical protein